MDNIQYSAKTQVATHGFQVTMQQNYACGNPDYIDVQ